jgi:hypothetical protein
MNDTLNKIFVACGWLAAGAIGILSTAYVASGPEGGYAKYYVIPMMFIVLAFGIYRISRLCALAALIVFAGSRFLFYSAAVSRQHSAVASQSHSAAVSRQHSAVASQSHSAAVSQPHPDVASQPHPAAVSQQQAREGDVVIGFWISSVSLSLLLMLGAVGTVAWHARHPEASAPTFES